MDKRQEENPGRIWGLPKQSIYEGLDEEARMLLAPSQDSERQADKGKAKERTDMDIG